MPNTLVLEDMLDIESGFSLEIPIGDNFTEDLGVFGKLRQFYSKAPKMVAKIVKKTRNVGIAGLFSLPIFLGAGCAINNDTPINGLSQENPPPHTEVLRPTYDFNTPTTERRHPETGHFLSQGLHKGMDFGAKEGTEVISATYGIVNRVFTDSCGGGMIYVNLPLEYKETITLKATGKPFTISLPVWAGYNHVIPLVKYGDKVEPGKVIARIGPPSEYSCVSFPHVHFMLTTNMGSPGSHSVDPKEHSYNGTGNGIRKGHLSCYNPKINYSRKVIGAVAPLKCR